MLKAKNAAMRSSANYIFIWTRGEEGEESELVNLTEREFNLYFISKLKWIEDGIQGIYNHGPIQSTTRGAIKLGRLLAGWLAHIRRCPVCAQAGRHHDHDRGNESLQLSHSPLVSSCYNKVLG